MRLSTVFRLTFGSLALALLTCCTSRDKVELPIDCNNTLTVNDSFNLGLFLVDKNGVFSSFLKRSFQNEVVSQAYYDCRRLEIAYSTHERNPKDGTGTINIIGQLYDKKIPLSSGINAFYPIKSGLFYVNGKALKRGSVPMSANQTHRTTPLNPTTELQIDPKKLDPNVYMEDAIVNIKLKPVVTIVKGGLNPLSFHGGVISAYSSTGVFYTYEINSEKDQVSIVSDQHIAIDSRTFRQEMGTWARYIFVSGSHYALNQERDSTQKNALPGGIDLNTLYKFSREKGTWIKIKGLGFEPLAAQFTESTFAFSDGVNFGVFKPKLNLYKSTKLDFEGYTPTSIGILEKGFVVAGTKGIESVRTSRSKIFFVSNELERMGPGKELEHFYLPRISTTESPVHTP